jgi:hypothetical protein
MEWGNRWCWIDPSLWLRVGDERSGFHILLFFFSPGFGLVVALPVKNLGTVSYSKRVVFSFFVLSCSNSSILLLSGALKAPLIWIHAPIGFSIIVPAVLLIPVLDNSATELSI